jgi:hypothetical protein
MTLRCIESDALRLSNVEVVLNQTVTSDLNPPVTETV